MRIAIASGHKLCRLNLHILSLLFAFTLSGMLAEAQSTNGSIHGTVTDSTGAVLPKVVIQLKNLGSGQNRTATTDEKGFYAITDLAPGHYAVLTSKSGFAVASNPDIEIHVSQDLELDSSLNVGQETTVVEVTDTPPVLSTASATLDQTIDSKETVDLPLNGRQFTQLLLLAPGASPVEGGQQSFYTISFGSGGLSPSVNGQLGGQNVFMIDGILNTHPFIESWAISPPPDAIEEFKSQNHVADAQFSLSSGAIVNLVTKSGTGKFHGSAWEFVRNQVLDAANYFDNFSGIPKPPYTQNQYGFTFGGPMILPLYDGRKRNTHFFGYYEGFRSDEGFTELTNVPTTEELSGDFSDLLTTTQATDSSGNPLVDALGRPIIVGQLYNPYSTRTVNGQAVRDPISNNQLTTVMAPNAAALAYLNALYNPPNFGPGGNTFPNRKDSATQTTRSNQFGIGGDHTFKNNDVLFAKFFYSQPDMTGPSAVKFGAEETENHARVLATSYTHLFSPTFLMTTHYGYSWLFYQYSNQPAPAGLASTINSENFDPVQNGLTLVPQLSIAPRIGSPNAGGAFTQYGIAQGPMRTHQFNVDLQKVHGEHTISTGFLYMHVHAFDNGWGASAAFDQYPSANLSNGNFVASTGDGLASMLLDLPSGYSTDFGNTGADLTTNWYGAYVQDKWQVTKKLNVQIGVRWDFQQPPHYKDNQFAVWNSDCPYGDYSTPDAVTAIEEKCLLLPFKFVPAPTATNPNPAVWPTPNVRSSIFAPNYHGWSPRFGLAYSITPKTVLRASFNIFDDHNAFDKEVQDPRGSYPVGGSIVTSNLNRGFPEVLFDNLPTVAEIQSGSSLTINRAANPNLKIPYVMQYNLGIQRQVMPNTNFEVDYVGSGSRHLWGTYAYNQPLPGTYGPNAIPDGQPFPFISGIIQADDNLFSSSYNALQVKLDRSYSHGLMFTTSYAYSRCMNEVGGEYSAFPQNSYDFRADWGRCLSDTPHLFSFSPVYELPFGRGRQFGSNLRRGMDLLVGGWSVGNITSIHSGLPFSVSVPYDVANVGHTGRASFVPGCKLLPSGFKQSRSQWYNPACFVAPPLYTFGDTKSNAYRGPDYINFDIVATKNFYLSDSKSIQIRAEGFNIFNHTNLGMPSSDIGTSTFMQIFSASSAREIQFAGKFSF